MYTSVSTSRPPTSSLATLASSVVANTPSLLSITLGSTKSGPGEGGGDVVVTELADDADDVAVPADDSEVVTVIAADDPVVVAASAEADVTTAPADVAGAPVPSSAHDTAVAISRLAANAGLKFALTIP